MWTVEYSAETTATAAAVWQAWADVSAWSQWNPDVERAALTGSFAEHGRIEMTLHDGGTVPLRIVAAAPGKSFVDEADLDGTVIRTLHVIEPQQDGRVRVVYRLEAEGPAAEQLGPAISADFPETIDALLAYAAR